MATYKTAIIGVGRIGYLLQKDKKREQPASHSSALSKNNRIKLIAGCDINKERLDSWQRDYPRARIYSDFIKLMDDENPDIVVIAVDEIFHLDVALKVIDYKPKLIILEKPVAPDLQSALKIKKASELKRVPILINHERRFSKDYLILKELIKNNKIGFINSITASICSGMKVWHKRCIKDGSCLLIHDGTHLIDIIYNLLNYKLADPVIDNININKKNEVLSLFLHYNLKKNKIINIEFNGQKDYFGFELDIKGKTGRIIIGNGYFKYYQSVSSPYYENFKSLIKNRKIKKPKKTGYFTNMVQNCVDYLDRKNKLVSTLNEGVNVLQVLYEIIDKIKQ